MTNSEARKRIQAQNPASLPASIDGSPETATDAPSTLNGPLAANLDWQVGVVARTVEGDVTLRMTVEQADELRDCLVWLTGDGDE